MKQRPRLRRAGFMMVVPACAAALLGGSVTGGFAAPRAAVPAAVSIASGFPATGRYLQNFAPTYMTPTTRYTAAQAVQVAQDYDVVAAHAGQFAAYLAQMKAANPKLVVLIYFNGSFAQSNQGTLYPDAWYAHDATGSKVRSRNFGNYLMDIGSSGWSGRVSQQCAADLAAFPYDGCFIDMLGDALLSGSYLTSVPIDPATGLPWTAKERMDATTAIAQAVVNGAGGKLVMANGLKAGTRYFDATAPTSELFAAAQGALAETWLRQATRPITFHESEAAWQKDVNMLGDATTRGRAIAVTAKVWIPATQAQIDQWHAFSLASFLLGTQGTAYYAFLSPKTASAFTTAYSWDHINLGTPLEAYGKVAGVYQRRWTAGIALANPTTSPQSATVARACTTLAGTAVPAGGSVALGPESGDVCVYS